MVVLCLLLFTFLTNTIGFHNKYPFVPNKQNIIIMGCDYYIETDLEIRLKSGNVLTKTLSSEKCYFSFDYDSDEEDYNETWNHYKDACLTVTQPPRLLYENYTFVNTYLEQKYKQLIDTLLSKNKKTMKQVISIYKTESRRLR
jgi:hypothetical protein